MNMNRVLPIGFHLWLPALLLAGCASKSGAPAAPLVNRAAAIPFRQFDHVQLNAVEFDTSLKGADKTKVLAQEMDQGLLEGLGRVLSHVTPVPAGGDFPPATGRTLQISPRIEKAHVVTQFERNWFTWGAGDTEILIRVSYRDASTGDLVAEPRFYRKADLFDATWSGGAKDLEARENLVKDVVDYTQANR